MNFFQIFSCIPSENFFREAHHHTRPSYHLVKNIWRRSMNSLRHHHSGLIILCLCFTMSSASSIQNSSNPLHPVGEFLRIGMVGVKPYLFREGSKVRGRDMLLLQLLSKKLRFNYNITFGTSSFGSIVKMVRHEWIQCEFVRRTVNVKFVQTANGTFDIGWGQFGQMHNR